MQISWNSSETIYIAKELIISIHYILHEWNSCANIFAILRANNSDHLVTINEHMPCLSSILLGDALDVFFSKT